MYFDWQPRYALGIGPMDDAHKRLMSIMNRLHEQRAAKEAKPLLRRTLKELADYTRQHFSEEEAYMASIAFPGLERHKRIHVDLLGQLDEHLGAFETGTGELSDAFFAFLKTWLSAHIVGIDGKYGEHARQQKR